METKTSKKTNLAWNSYNDSDLKEVFALSERYKDFISLAKTERECVNYLINVLNENGFYDLKKIIKNKKTLKAGDKVYYNNMNKSLIAFVIGKQDIENGLRIIGSHIDAPRIDIKQNPLYEESGLAFLDTHYYGGIKKYQWVTLPLAIHGVVVKKDGTIIDISIGEDENDPVIGISDLLIHLSAEQLDKKAAKVIEGENLNILIGSIPLKSDEKDLVKRNVMKILNEKYGIDEIDFISAELEVVPAGKARDYGLDKSMIMGYAHDDRVCAYTSLEALIKVNNPMHTMIALFVDKEEIGSVGATGMHSKFFENCLADMMDCMGVYSELKLRRTLQNSKMLSADVTAAFDPNFPNVSEKNNTAYFGKGVVFSKYTGARGKSGCNDANAEYMAYLRNLMDSNNITWQTSELGKVDQGGGGTIAYILA